MDDYHNADIGRIAARVAAPDGLPVKVALLRHGRRERIASATLQAAYTAQLTAEGLAQARALGALLSPTRPTRLFYSPVPRCEGTARAIAEGLTAQGGEASVEGSRVFLAAGFVRDGQGLVAEISQVGLSPFVRRWFRGELPPELVLPARDAAAALLEELLATCREGDELDLHVSHDLVLMALLGLAWDMAAEEAPWPGYLEAVLICRDAERLSLWFQGEERTIQGL